MTNLTAGLLARHTPKGPTGRSAARDVYDLVWVGGTTPHSTFDQPCCAGPPCSNPGWTCNPEHQWRERICGLPGAPVQQ